MGNVFDYIFITTLYSMFVLIWLVILGIGKFAPTIFGTSSNIFEIIYRRFVVCKI